MLTHTLSLVLVLMVQRIEGQGQCMDTIQNCAQYGQNVCSDPQYDSWAQQNCALFCHKCAAVPATPAPAQVGGCRDSIQNCNQYGQTVCSDPQYDAWAKQNCAGTCHKCGSGGVVTQAPAMPVVTMPATSAPAQGGGSCTDAIQNCAQYGQNVCNDQQYDAWAKQNCAGTCNKCSGGGGVVTQGPAIPVTRGCADSIQDCNQFGQSVCSDTQYDAWARQNCARTCNKCSSGGGGGGPGIVTQPPGSQGFTGSSSGCAYKGQVYGQGQSWNDGCTYKCTCTDGSTGQYSCQEMCYTFNIPPACHMVGPAPGKCCQTPSCPPTVTIQYPPGYVVN